MGNNGEISGRRAAGLLGISDANLRKWRKRPDWVYGPPPYTTHQIDQIQLWALRALRRRPARLATQGTVGAEPESVSSRRSSRSAPEGDQDRTGEVENSVEQELADLSDVELETMLRRLVADVKQNRLDPPVAADTLLKVEKIRSERQRRGLLIGKYLLREAVEAQNLAKIRAVRVGFEQLGQAAAPLLVGLDDRAEIEGIISEISRRVVHAFAQNVSKSA